MSADRENQKTMTVGNLSEPTFMEMRMPDVFIPSFSHSASTSKEVSDFWSIFDGQAST